MASGEVFKGWGTCLDMEIQDRKEEEAQAK